MRVTIIPSPPFFFCLDSPRSGHLIQGQWWQLCHKTFNLSYDSEGPCRQSFHEDKEAHPVLFSPYIDKMSRTSHQECEPDGMRTQLQGAFVIYIRRCSKWNDPKLWAPSLYLHLNAEHSTSSPGLSWKLLRPPDATPHWPYIQHQKWECTGSSREQWLHSTPVGSAFELPAICPARRPWLTFPPRREETSNSNLKTLRFKH